VLRNGSQAVHGVARDADDGYKVQPLESIGISGAKLISEAKSINDPKSNAMDPETPSYRYFVGLGANLGNRIATLKAAITQLSPWLLAGSLRHSSYWESEALDGPGPNYINAVIAFASPLKALALLDELQIIEQKLGRRRSTPNAPRTLDLDLLLADDLQLQEDRLQIPHPRMHQRAFVLYPLLELDPDLIIPGLGAASGWLQANGSQVCRRWTA
jgi:2-amino-4-hydroxy-6-hydroxymethyldihydropteridine diphosphokinase